MTPERFSSFRWRMPRFAPFLGIAIAACFIGGMLQTAEAHLLHQRHHQKMYASPYFSLHKTKRLPSIDFAEGRAEDIDTALELRSYKNEIIVLVFTKHSIRWMVHYARMCQSLGFDHFIAVGSSKEDCNAFRHSWCSTEFGGPGETVHSEGGEDDGSNATSAAASTCQQLYPGCAWVSPTVSLDGKWEWQHMPQRPVERLWLFRYWFALHAMRRGVNSLISDLDVVIHGDFYSAVKAPPLDSQQFYQMPGSLWPNGGLIYIQNAHPEGPVSYMLEESVLMGLAIYRHRDAEPQGIGPKTLAAYCSGNDQDCLEAAMLASGMNRSIHEWKCLRRMDADGIYESDFKPRWEALFSGQRKTPVPVEGPTALNWTEWESTKALGPRGKLKPDEELVAVRPMFPAHAAQACVGAAQCHRLAEWARSCIDTPPRFTRLWNPPEALARGMPAMSEVAVSSPQYLLGDTNPIVYGWGDWNPHRTWSLVNHLVAFGPSFGWSQHRRKGGGRNNRLHIIQAQGLWHAPYPLPERLLRVSQPLVDAAAAHPTSENYRQLIRSLMVAAAVTNRTAVLPHVRCAAASWIQRDQRARHGFADPSFVTITAPWKVATPPGREPKAGEAAVTGEEESENALCTPYLSFWDECNDKVVLSDFHIFQEASSRGLSEASVLLSTGDNGAGGAGSGVRRSLREATVGDEPDKADLQAPAGPAPSARVPFQQLREAAARADAGSVRVLWLAGDIEAALRLSRDVPEMKAQLQPKELEALDRVCKICPDYAYQESFLLYYR